MRIRKEKIEAAMAVLGDVLTAAKMEGASFLAPGERIPFSEPSKRFTAEILGATQVYRDTYILEPLNDAIADLRAELDRAYGSGAKEEAADGNV